MCEVVTLDSRQHPPWLQQTGSGFPTRFPMCPTCLFVDSDSLRLAQSITVSFQDSGKIPEVVTLTSEKVVCSATS